MIIQVSEGVTCLKTRRDPEGFLYPAKQGPEAGFHMANAKNPHRVSSKRSDDPRIIIFWSSVKDESARTRAKTGAIVTRTPRLGHHGFQKFGVSFT